VKQRWWPLALIVTLGCGQLTGPSRADIYDYRLFVTKGASVDTLSFHWPRELLPVRVWIAPDDSLQDALQLALARWQGVFLYGEFTATMVDDSSVADIIVQNSMSPNGEGVPTQASLCAGLTDVDTTASATAIQLPIHIYVWAFATTSPVDECYRVATTHEFGHAIGLLAHSPDPGDVMYRNPTLDGLSARDSATAEVLYHITPTLTVTGRR
jgi:predicted Zn-dependent protease